MRKTCILVVSTCMLTGCAYDSAFLKTNSGTIEIKDIPASTVLTTESDGEYFDNADDMFMELFGYIKKNDVSMTVPVSGGISSSRMTFYVGKNEINKKLEDAGKVRASTRSQYQVVSIGGRGKYSRSNLRKSEEELLVWLEQNKAYRTTGEPYAVFWNSPFTPGFMKRYEIHVPRAC